MTTRLELERKLEIMKKEYSGIFEESRRYLARKRADADQAEFERKLAAEKAQEQMAQPKKVSATYSGIPGVCHDIHYNGGDPQEEFNRKPDKPLPDKLAGVCTGVRFNGKRIEG